MFMKKTVEDLRRVVADPAQEITERLDETSEVLLILLGAITLVSLAALVIAVTND